MGKNKGKKDKKHQGDIPEKNQFAIWIFKLKGKVEALEQSISTKDVQFIIKDMETYRSEVQSLHEYAKQHNVDISEYSVQFTAIYQHLQTIEWKAKEKTQEQNQFPLFDILRIIGSVSKVIAYFVFPPLAMAIEEATKWIPKERGPKPRLIPQLAESLLEQPDKPITLQPYRLNSPTPKPRPSFSSYYSDLPTLLPPLPTQKPPSRKYTLSELQSSYPELKASSTEPPLYTKPQSSFVNNTPLYNFDYNFDFLVSREKQVAFTSYVPCRYCRARPTKLYFGLNSGSYHGYYCIKHYPQKP